MTVPIRYLLSSILAANCVLFAQTLPTLKSVAVTAIVNSEGDIFRYSYSVTNSPVSAGAVWSIGLDISQPLGGTLLSRDGLVNGPGFLEDTSNAVLGRAETVPMVAIAAQAPAGWVCSVAVNGRIVWGAEDQAALIPGGGKTGGYELNSRGLPGIRTVVLEPFLDLSQLPIAPPSGPSDLNRYDNELAAMDANIRLTGKTVGPTAPPANFVALDFLKTIESYKEQALQEGWIDNRGIANSLDVKINVARQALQAGDIGTAKKTLKALLNEVDAQAGKHLTPEAVALLQFNTQYLIGKLP